MFGWPLICSDELIIQRNISPDGTIAIITTDTMIMSLYTLHRQGSIN